MRFNMIGFVLSDIIAKNRGVPSATALRDGLLGGVVGSPLLGVVLASVISQNQESSATTGAPAPTLAKVTFDVSNKQVSITGTNFGTAPAAITVTFSWPVGFLPQQATETVPLPPQLVGQLNATSFTMNAPSGLPLATTTSLVVTVNGLTSGSQNFQLPS
jgi:hypothetical protein